MFCKACGNQIPDGAGFCGSCGAPTAVAVPADVPVDAPVDTPVDQPTEDVAAAPEEAAVTAEEAAAAVQGAAPAEAALPAEAVARAEAVPPPEAAVPAEAAPLVEAAAPDLSPPGAPTPPVFSQPPIFSQPHVASSPPVQPPPVFTPPVFTPPAPTPTPAAYAARGAGGAGAYGAGTPGAYGAGTPGAYGAGGPSGYGPYGPGAYGGPPAPAKKSNLGLWIGIAAAVVVLIGAGLAVWLVVLNKDDGTPETTSVVQTTSTTVRSTTSTSVASSSTSTTPTTAARPAGAPGDSAGEWTEVDISGVPADAYAVALSDDALLIDAKRGDDYALYAYMLDSKTLVELPIDGNDFTDEDIDGTMAVWFEGTYDEATDEITDHHIYAYPLPDGPKVEVVGGEQSVHYPHVSGQWVTWVEDEPFPDSPDEYRLLHIFGVKIDSTGAPVGDPTELVSSATAFVSGDYPWIYSLSGTHLAWENATTVESFDPGIYMMDLTTLQPLLVGSESWRPSIGGDTLVYTGTGLMAAGLNGGQVRTIDPLGDFATAAPTFAAYFRSVQTGDATSYEIVARGFTGGYEQVLGQQTDAPWLSPAIAASAKHVAFIIAGVVHLFEWQPVPTY